MTRRPTTKRKPTPPRTAFVILEYRGGARTDALHRQLSGWNPNARILVLDNASPDNKAKSITHRNKVNSYVGGGIRDCLALAESLGAEYLFYCANDVEVLTPLIIAEFETVMDAHPDVVLTSCALTPDTVHVDRFPWMIRGHGTGFRRVRSVDLLCCLIRVDFIRGFGGFPISKGGWGYFTEAAYQAKLQSKRLLVNDRCVIRHVNASLRVSTPEGLTHSKSDEAKDAYRVRYGDIERIRIENNEPGFDERVYLKEPGNNGKRLRVSRITGEPR